jgi:hypothetical protein
MTTATERSTSRPEFNSRRPHFNHVAMSLPAELLGGEGSRQLVDFYSTVFGWEELPMMTDEGRRLVFQAYTLEQFVFLIADEPPMVCPRLDHFGISVGAESELDDVLARAKAYKKRDDRVDIIDKKVEDHGMLAITSCYIRYLLPMMVELQWWNMKDIGAQK